MTVIALWYEKTRKGLDLAVLSDQRRLQTHMETGETRSMGDGFLKSVALSDSCCVACAGGTKVSEPLFCYLAKHEDWLEQTCDDSFDAARKIERLPKRVGVSFNEAVDIVDERFPVLLAKMCEVYAEHEDQDPRGDTAVFVVGRQNGRPLFIEWSAATEFQAEPKPYTAGRGITLRLPDQYGQAKLLNFIRKLRLKPNPLPIQVRARNAMQYVGSLGIYASKGYSLRRLSDSFRLHEKAFV